MFGLSPGISRNIPEHLIVDGCKVGKWWREINKKIRKGIVSDEVVHVLDENKIDCDVPLLYQEDWHQMAK